MAEDNTDPMLWHVWHVISCADGWGELDRYDVLTLRVVPKLMVTCKEHAELYNALNRYARFSVWDTLNDIFDRAVQQAGAADSFSDWADQMEHFDGER